MTNRLHLLFVSSAVFAVGLTLTACSSRKSEINAGIPTTVKTSVLQVRRSNVAQSIEAVGTVRSQEVAQIAAQVMGNITSVAVREGDSVRRGQVLVTVDDTQPQAGVERAQAALAAAEHEVTAANADYELAASTLKRYQMLYEKKSVSPQEFDEVSTRLRTASAHRDLALSGVAQAKAALAQARTTANFTQIRAPFDGVVSARRMDPGALAVPGTPLLTVEKTGQFRLEANVDESQLRYIKLGQETPVRVDAVSDELLAGKVVEIVPAADPSSRTFLVKVQLPANPNMRSGLFGRAYFNKGQREALMVPRAAVVDRGQLQGVYVVGPNQVAELHYVTLGKSEDDRVEVLSGLQPDEQLVAAPGAQELSGKKIE
jgi:RND family efflux transporter MFP subunit